MNTYDKTSLYEMSYAFMRRFAFIRVSAPEIPSTDAELVALMREYADVWEIETNRQTLTTVGRVWRAMNHAVEGRAIGPAIVMDILAYVTEHPGTPLRDKITRAVISYIFPQLEGVPGRRTIVRAIANVDGVSSDELDRTAREMLQTEPLDDG